MKRLSLFFLCALVLSAGSLPAHGAPAPMDREPDAWFLLPWSAPGAPLYPGGVGRIVGQEADSFGPGGFAVSSRSDLFVLDQVNLRVVVLTPDGAPAGEIPLPASTFEDIEQVDDRALLLLDRSAGQGLLALDLTGRPIADVFLPGRGIPHPGQVTAILPRSDGVWLEVAHRYSVRVLGSDLTPCPRRVRRGRPGRDGQSLHGALTNDGGARIWRTNGVDRRVTAETILGADLPVRRIVWLDQAPSGELVAVLEAARFDPAPPHHASDQHDVIVQLNAALEERTRFTSPWGLSELYQRGEIRVAPDGSVWQMAMTADGALLLRWDRSAP